MLAGCGAGAGEQAEISGPVDSRPPTFVAPVTTTTAPPAVVSLPVPTDPTTRATTTTAPAKPAVSAPAPTRPPMPAPLGPAAAGTYLYDTTGQTTLGGSTSPYPAVTTLVIDAPAGNRQHGVRDLRDTGRNGPLFDSVFEYRTDGLYLVSFRATVGVLLFSDSEELAAPAPVLMLPTGAAPGYHRDIDLPTASGGVAHLAIDVVREEKVKAVDTRVLHILATLPGAYNAHLDLTIWLGPSSLWVREHVVADATAIGIAFRTEYDATLRG